ncbi:MAG: CTP synthase [Pyrinomonadaceae bacterium]|nr:CTP synthase [Pyrinomonadaceae bacterium]
MNHDKQSSSLRFGLIGDYSPQVRAHASIPQALALAPPADLKVEVEWLATETLDENSDSRFAAFDALWCVPASPYASMGGALRAIRFAREHGVPFLGTCGGFQHALIEYARNVRGMTEADHAESNPKALMPLIAPLSCSLVGAKGKIELLENSRARSIYGAGETSEEYHCSYGFNPQYHTLLDDGALRVTGVDADGGVRVVELDGHPFFIATLFQPELSALSGNSHPLITAYKRAAQARERLKLSS